MKVLALLVVAATAGSAHAQECHPLPAAHVPEPPSREASADPRGLPIAAVRAGFSLETAAIDDGLGRRGTFEGAVTSLEVSALGARARVAIGGYHVDWGQRATGLGDLQIALQRAVATLGETRIGAAMSATLPTGDVRDELGMGHPMVMPGVWARWADDRSSLLASLVYGSMLGGHHHGMVEPITSPMNAEEMAAALRAARSVGATELAATLSGAAPIGPGLARGAVGAGARWWLAGNELGVEVSVPFGGTPIRARLVVDLARGF